MQFQGKMLHNLTQDKCYLGTKLVKKTVKYAIFAGDEKKIPNRHNRMCLVLRAAAQRPEPSAKGGVQFHRGRLNVQQRRF
jgi:hypothetical protein